MKNAATKLLKDHRDRLTRQQLATLKGQILAGDAEGAMRGLRRLRTKEVKR